MCIKFTKMQGLGNDFMVIDAVHQSFYANAEQIQAWADRHFGVGFDQLLIVAKATDSAADFRYRIFNADGSEVEQCGNGARCLARFIFEQGLSKKRRLSLQTIKGLMSTERIGSDSIKVSLGVPMIEPKSKTLLIDNNEYVVHLIDVGNPHVVIVVDDLTSIDVTSVGQQIETHSFFPQGVNVSFMQIVNDAHVLLRVWERGAGLTQACGSAACAAVAFGCVYHTLSPSVVVEFSSGTCEVHWQNSQSTIYLTGPAKNVYFASLSESE